MKIVFTSYRDIGERRNMDAVQPIGLGVIGYGGIAQNCLDAVQIPDTGFNLKALAGISEAELSRYGQRYGAGFTTTDYRKLIEHPEVEAVAIYTPDPLHLEMIEAALLAGKHVVVTKPMVISTDQAERVIQLVEQTGKTLVVGETSRYSLYCQAARTLVDEDDLGRLVFGETHYVHDMRPVFDKTPWRYLEPKDFPIGSMCHPVSLLTWYLGDVEELFAYGVNSGVDPRYPADTPDTYLVNLKFKNGAIGRILGAFGIVEPPLPMETLKLFGTKGSLVHNEVVFDKIPGKPVLTARHQREEGFDGHEGEVRRYMEEFAREIREGIPSSSSALDAAKTAAIGEAIKESVATGKPVSVRANFSSTAAGAVSQVL
jgi:predicted dehydrogenase